MIPTSYVFDRDIFDAVTQALYSSSARKSNVARVMSPKPAMTSSGTGPECAVSIRSTASGHHGRFSRPCWIPRACIIYEEWKSKSDVVLDADIIDPVCYYHCGYLGPTAAVFSPQHL
jgi:hypothetical protein